MSAHEFNQDVSAALRHAALGQVVITDRGEPAFALLSIEECRGLVDDGVDLVDRLSMDDEVDIEFAHAGIETRAPEL